MRHFFHPAPPTAIGDVQGCYAELQALLAQATPPFWFCGDLVNRGPDSLACLRTVKHLCEQGQALTVLGNHDLHLLAVSQGIRPLHASDTLSDILQAPDRNDLLDWLRQQPLAHFSQGHLLVHAGVLPAWSVEQTLSLAREVQAQLSGTHWVDFLRTMYGNQPDYWDDSLQGADRWRVVVNALTRLRFCTVTGAMDFKAKEAPAEAPAGYLPWFEVPNRRTGNVTVVFGHWSALGLVLRPNLVALDTGCVWGGQLTAISLNAEWTQRRVLQVRNHTQSG
jgi:bis(5'-nucleosyl)-tetraphosphatase (symmetrical)